ncbi:MAG: WbqC family protein [Candidatus Omnitrophica bacterium]|nr:WbqC family protein [Candidatus Omnitrophota bacterium]
MVYQEYHHPKYRQQFSRGEDDFEPFMSIVDLVFNEGQKARTILQS